MKRRSTSLVCSARDGAPRVALFARSLALSITLSGALSVAGCALIGDHARRASVELLPAPGLTARGTVTFVENPDGVQVTYNLAGLPPDSDHGLHIHDSSDCIGAGPEGIGNVFNPLQVPAGATRSAHIEGDLPNVHADANGVANGFFVVTDLALDGVRSVIGHVLVVHRDADDPYAMAQTISDGPRLACGVIRR
ncbi:superoxide dismutase family protein [Pararobbsia silviterrae]|uniref:Superoxide dismutase family protein n=1 Tax=Pararobbsia silviterrae TaxID=1792498 RepID=A0A494Y1P6_9BURK|nr:superoxide dismutase family protein [Pararobbsia silviterrae]RKP56684.1 superoxide dismutase family protein [Pararobbsia silviterrae]